MWMDVRTDALVKIVITTGRACGPAERIKIHYISPIESYFFDGLLTSDHGQISTKMFKRQFDFQNSGIILQLVEVRSIFLHDFLQQTSAIRTATQLKIQVTSMSFE